MNPSTPQARLVLADALRLLGRYDDALVQLDAAERLAPDTFWVQSCATVRSITLLQAGRLEQAIEEAGRSVRFGATLPAMTQSILCLALAGRRGEALDALRRLREVERDLSFTQIANTARYAYQQPGEADEYIAITRSLWDLCD